jgi:hypothetical protein
MKEGGPLEMLLLRMISVLVHFGTELKTKLYYRKLYAGLALSSMEILRVWGFCFVLAQAVSFGGLAIFYCSLPSPTDFNWFFWVTIGSLVLACDYLLTKKLIRSINYEAYKGIGHLNPKNLDKALRDVLFLFDDETFLKIAKSVDVRNELVKHLEELLYRYGRNEQTISHTFEEVYQRTDTLLEILDARHMLMNPGCYLADFVRFMKGKGPLPPNWKPLREHLGDASSHELEVDGANGMEG